MRMSYQRKMDNLWQKLDQLQQEMDAAKESASNLQKELEDEKTSDGDN